MPTAAKLFAAFAFGLVGFFTAEVLKPSFPQGSSFGFFSPICGALGVLAGWRVMGPEAGSSSVKGIGSGLKTSAVLVAWALFIFGVREMVIRSTGRRYDGVLEAVEGLFEIMLEYAVILGSSSIALTVLVVGGALGGMFSSWAAVRWR